MFNTPTATRHSYVSWLLTAGQLSPAYDYFDFANTFDGNQRCLNRWYGNAMKKALEDAKEADKFEIAQKINEFNGRNTENTAFFKRYQEYWSSRNSNELQERIAKRQRRAAESSNEEACSAFETIIKKIAAAASGNEAVNNSSADEDSDSVRASSSSANHSSQDSKEKVTEDLENYSFDELGEKFIFLDKDSIQHNETAQILAGPTKLPIKPLTHDCRLLLNKLANCAPSTRLMRELIRSYPLTMEEPFDLSIHADLNFTEVMCTHFLNLMDSPRNPMQQQQLERNTAFLTTIPILHNMFIDSNDIIDMQWIEKQTPLTGDVKWDGVAFLIKNKLVTPLFVELSGGIDCNSGAEKARGDEEKMIRQLIKLLKLKKAEGSDLPHQCYIRYHDLKIHFESLFYFGEYYIKRTYFELLCPTPTQLQKFVERIPDLFQYRQALLDQLKA
ncbi:hypothetical protein PS15m_008448 [Mucor circinelloides]